MIPLKPLQRSPLQQQQQHSPLVRTAGPAIVAPATAVAATTAPATGLVSAVPATSARAAATTTAASELAEVSEHGLMAQLHRKKQ
jgi:hypothetical protein